MYNGEFRSRWSEDRFIDKYQMLPGETWAERTEHVVNDVAKPHASRDECSELHDVMSDFQFIPGGRYMYYGGRRARFWNNCYIMIGEEDTREEWARISHNTMTALMTGGGVGTDFSVFRPENALLRRTGGDASGPVPLIEIQNETGRRVMQGNTRRSALYASLHWQHADIWRFLHSKCWHEMEIKKGFTVQDAKAEDWNYPAPLDMTNISPNYDDHFIALINRGEMPAVFLENVRLAMMIGDPGFSFNCGSQRLFTGRNACTEVITDRDSNVCNLGSVNMAAIDSLDEFAERVRQGTRFLVYGTLGAQLPYEKVYKVREETRLLGLGLMGVHEWLLKRGYRYEFNPELHRWAEVYERVSEESANELCDELGISRPVSYRAIAPTGTISMMAGTTSGIEPLYAVAYKRRFLKKKKWVEETVVDAVAQQLIDEFGLDPEKIETSIDLAADPERRIKFQADMQDYVDMGISSTLNLPKWGTELNNEDKVEDFARIVAKYAPRLRGLTIYPDGGRAGQPITAVPYADAVGAREEAVDVCDLTGGGTCGA